MFKEDKVRDLEFLAEEFYHKKDRGFQLTREERNQLSYIEQHIAVIENTPYKETSEKENCCIPQRRGGKDV